MRVPNALNLAAVSALCVSAAMAQEPRCDGFFSEWSAVSQLATDPAGDASGAFDVRTLYATNRGTRLFLRFDITSLRNLQSGATADGTLLVVIGMPGNRWLTIDLRNRVLWRDNNTALEVGWDEVGYTTAPTHAATEFELVVDLGLFGVSLSSPITINFGSSDALSAPVPFTMSQPEVAVARRPAARPAGTAFRIASVNTEQTGLLNSTQRPKLLRLVDGVNADIYCFQEEYTSSAAQIDTHLTSADPMEDAANWNVHKNNDCVIASRSPLIALPSPNTATACAVVDLPAPGAVDSVVVFSIHPKCCGYISSSEDATRISQMNGVVSTVASLRSGALGSALEPYRQAPIMIIGDWNLVGSRTPLDMVLDLGGLNLRDALPAHLIGESLTTWRGTSTTAGSFTPGRLDLFAYQQTGLALKGAFVLDSATLNAGELAALGLQSGDSAATDHNMLIGDLAWPAPPCGGDANGDRLIDGTDIATVLSNWGGTGTGDLNADGIVDSSDMTAVLANFGGACP